MTNVDLTHRILALVGRPASLITPVADRPGHDRRYALDTTQAARARLGAVGRRSRRAWRPRSSGTARTSGGGGRSRNRTRRSARTTRRSTAAALAGLTPHAARPDARHRRDRLRRRPSARSAGAIARRSSRWYRPDGRSPTVSPHVDWRRRRSRSIARAWSPARRTTRSRRASTTWPARRTSTRRGRTSSPHLATNVLGTHHLLEAVRTRGPAVPRARRHVGAGLSGQRRADRRRRAARAGRVRTDSRSSRRIELALRAAARRRPRRRDRAAVQSRGPAAERRRSRSRASRGRSRGSRPASRRRSFASATSTRAATSPTSATSSPPTSA